MIVLKLALLTCAFYLVIAVLTQAVEIAAARVLGGVTISLAVWAVFFAFVWVVSFSLAWRVLTWRMAHGG